MKHLNVVLAAGVALALLNFTSTNCFSSCTVKECTEGNCWKSGGATGPAGCYELNQNHAECAYSSGGGGNRVQNGTLKYQYRTRATCTPDCTNLTSRAAVCDGAAGAWQPTNGIQVYKCDSAASGTPNCP